ncbi:N-acetyltransferase [Hymenobacter gummosus]|uniref:N-acetyltransferase n=1 Tax=Hymenobacter gummosus TaxID=1776032 RepID=A0A3S0HPI5_9BACT|nr:GNAT family N-acetyltransferase [Hymenobacter gummosus]RTQ50904.1 N-acetyltransferase [Hymenobacter gummosus]
MEIILNNVNHNDKDFIRKLFNDNLVKEYIILPSEIRHDPALLVDVWLDNDKNNSGATYIISVVEVSPYTRNEIFTPCGFISFERQSINTGNIAFALSENFRGKGITKTAMGLVLDVLTNAKVHKVEADIDKDNIASEKIVELFGFTTDRSKVYFDLENGAKLRNKWYKTLQ